MTTSTDATTSNDGGDACEAKDATVEVSNVVEDHSDDEDEGTTEVLMEPSSDGNEDDARMWQQESTQCDDESAAETANYEGDYDDYCTTDGSENGTGGSPGCIVS